MLLLAASSPAEHIQLEPLGKTYPINEPDLLAELHQQMPTPQQLHLETQQTFEEFQPKNIKPLPRASTTRVYYIDPTYTLDHDLTDGRGNLLYPKGYSFNPLNFIPFTGGLLVIDGSDAGQIEWLYDSPYITNQQIRLLVSGGNANALSEGLGRPVYYFTADVASRFQVAAVPALVKRDGDRFKVHEFSIRRRLGE
jgi:conjugal transfer pilus assembly protein TraW